MAYINKVKVTIANKYVIQAVKSIVIKSSWRNTMETCKLELPDLKKMLSKSIKEGDQVKVELSMSTSFEENDFVTEFIGYVASIQKSLPYTLHCENEVYIWKRKKAISKFYREIKLEDLLKELFGDIVVVTPGVPEFTLQNFKINRATPYEVLAKLKQNYLLTTYFRGGKLLIGTQYLTEKNIPTIRYNLDGDHGNIVKDELTFRSKESIRLKARVISILKDGKKLELTEGDSDGAERVLHYRNIRDEAALRKLAKTQLEKLKQDTAEGTIACFGLPYIKHSDLSKLKSEKFPEKNGTFFVDEVETTFGISGFRRKVKLGRKMSANKSKKTT